MGIYRLWHSRFFQPISHLCGSFLIQTKSAHTQSLSLSLHKFWTAALGCIYYSRIAALQERDTQFTVLEALDKVSRELWGEQNASAADPIFWARSIVDLPSEILQLDCHAVTCQSLDWGHINNFFDFALALRLNFYIEYRLDGDMASKLNFLGPSLFLQAAFQGNVELAEILLRRGIVLKDVDSGTSERLRHIFRTALMPGDATRLQVILDQLPTEEPAVLETATPKTASKPHRKFRIPWRKKVD